jgi:hypothetical protein
MSQYIQDLKSSEADADKCLAPKLCGGILSVQDSLVAELQMMAHGRWQKWVVLEWCVGRVGNLGKIF